MRALLPAVVAVLMVLGWWALSLTQPEILLPGPGAVLSAMWASKAQLAQATWQTTRASLVGLLLGSGVGIAGAVLFLRSRWLERALYPYALFLQTLPIIAIAPLLVVWLGYGQPVAVTTAAIVSFFPILSSANAGLRSPERSELELMRLYGATWTQTLLKLRVPRALPTLLAGYRSAVGLSVIGAIVGEFVGSNGLPPSLGFLVLSSARSADTALTFGAVFCSAALAGVLFLAVRGVEKLAIGRWHGD
ncbi:MAG: ABC transporter permease [Myxococcota bacterium]|nr:ABC transporter permease [Myxococcota bacterium]